MPHAFVDTICGPSCTPSCGCCPVEPAPDLRHVISDDAALISVEISYRIDEQLIVMRGDGSVFMQSTRQQLPLLPTCKGKVTRADVRRLLETMLTAQFLNLPQKSYIMLNGDEADWRKLQLHSISIKVAGGEREARFFCWRVWRRTSGNSREIRNNRKAHCRIEVKGNSTGNALHGRPAALV